MHDIKAIEEYNGGLLTVTTEADHRPSFLVDATIDELTACCWFLRKTITRKSGVFEQKTITEYFLEPESHGDMCILSNPLGYHCDDCRLGEVVTPQTE